jgi:hypothetical protein
MSTTLTAICRLFGARLVHLLDDLKRQKYIADLAGLTIPDQFHLALVGEKQEAILTGNGLSASIKRMISCCSCSVSRGM